ncbi:MAG: hypothetical protein WBM62_15205 [Crocosphaera sp.]
MKNKLTSLALLGASMGTGLLLSLVPITSVYAGTLNQDIVDQNGQKMGNVAFDWDDSEVIDGSLKDFDSLTSFSFTDYNNNIYDLTFAQNADFKKFEYNLSPNELTAIAIIGDTTTPTGRDGFRFEPMTFSQVDGDEFNASNIQFSESIMALGVRDRLDIMDHVILQESESLTVDPSVDPAESVPENGLATALLIITGLVVVNPKKKI